MKTPKIVPLLFLCVLLPACAAHTNLEPVGKGAMSADAGLGGPIIEAFDTNIPVPYATLGGAMGVDDRIDVNASLHLLPLAYKVGGIDAGVTWYPLLRDGWKPTVGLQPRLFIFTSLKQHVPERIKAYPAFSFSVAWGLHSGLFYAGGDVLTVLAEFSYDDEGASVLFSPFLGYRWEIGEELYLFTEVKWQGSNARSDQLAVEYLPIGQHGAVSTLFSIQRRF